MHAMCLQGEFQETYPNSPVSHKTTAARLVNHFITVEVSMTRNTVKDLVH